MAWKRAALGIANRFLEHPRWTKKEIALLGRMPDKKVALKTGRTVAAVEAKRFALEIPPWR